MSESTNNEEPTGTKPEIPAEAIDVSTKQDGGVMKLIKREGTGNEQPQNGHTVSVHYVGTLPNGEQFDSSRDRDIPFEFELGKGRVIKAWDQGVASMRRGELALLYCGPEYAYGKAGSPPQIPANAHLIFEVELLDWQGEDVTDDKDGGVRRWQLISEGEGWQNPKNCDTVGVHLVGRLHSDPAKVFDDRHLEFCVGEGSLVGVCAGVEVALRKMKKNEKSLFVLKANYAFGLEGNEELSVAPNETVQYEIGLEKFEKLKQSWELTSVDEKIEAAELAKAKGTELFKKGLYQFAARWYSKITEYLSSDVDDDEEEEAKGRRERLLLAGHLNVAICQLKCQEAQAALESCQRALELDGNNVKAIFRLATANMQLKSYRQALDNFNRVLELEPDNKAAKTQAQACLKLVKQEDQRQRKLFSTMFKGVYESPKAGDKADDKAEKLSNGDVGQAGGH